MKTVLTTLAMALACAGCGSSSPTLNNLMSNININEVVNAAGKGQQLMEGQRDITQAEEITLGSGIASNFSTSASILF